MVRDYNENLIRHRGQRLQKSRKEFYFIWFYRISLFKKYLGSFVAVPLSRQFKLLYIPENVR